jgi:hypothetical protein
MTKRGIGVWLSRQERNKGSDSMALDKPKLRRQTNRMTCDLLRLNWRFDRERPQLWGSSIEIVAIGYGMGLVRLTVNKLAFRS